MGCRQIRGPHHQDLAAAGRNYSGLSHAPNQIAGSSNLIRGMGGRNPLLKGTGFGMVRQWFSVGGAVSSVHILWRHRN